MPYWFRDVESFVFWLQAIPLPNDLHIPTHAPIAKRIIETHWTADGLRTNEHRRLLIARKPVTPPEEGIADGR